MSKFVLAANPVSRRIATALLGLALGAVPDTARALEVTSEQRSACMGDAFRLCSSEIPDVDRVLVCMRVHKASLSDHCRAVLPR